MLVTHPEYLLVWVVMLESVSTCFAANNNNNNKESAEDREALGLNGSQAKKTSGSGSQHDRETFQGQIAVSFCFNHSG